MSPLLLLLATLPPLLAFVDRCEEGQVVFSSRNSKSGVFASPGWPKKYPEHIRCAFRFIGNANERVQVQFHAFNIEGLGSRCKKDFVDIYIQISDESKPLDDLEKLLGRYCGHSVKSVPNFIVSLYHVLVIDLFSDQNTQRVYNNDIHMGQLGFNATYKFVSKDTYDIGEPLPGSSDCSFVISSSRSGPTGTLRSPTYPGLYPDNLTCTYVFRGRPSERIRLEFIDFDLHEMTNVQLLERDDMEVASCPVDAIRFFDSTERDESKVIAKTFCGVHKDLEIFSTGPELHMEFESGTGRVPREKDPRDHGDWRELQRRGFLLSYTFSSHFVNVRNGDSHWRGTECDYLIKSSGKNSGFFNFPPVPADSNKCAAFFQGIHNSQRTEVVKLNFKGFHEIDRSVNCPTSVTISVFLKGQTYREKADRLLCYTGSSSAPQLSVRSRGPQIFLLLNNSQTHLKSRRISIHYQFITDFGIPGVMVRPDTCLYVYNSRDYPSGGKTTSPFFNLALGQHYPFNITCWYHFRAASPSQRIRLRFTNFYVADFFIERKGNDKRHHTAGSYVPCQADYLQVIETYRDPSNPREKRNVTVLTYCGTSIPGPYVSEFESDEIILKFESTWENEAPPEYGRRGATGFQVLFDFPKKVDVFTGNRSVLHCGGNISSLSHGGLITTPNYPTRYPDNLICEWHIYPVQKHGQLFVQFPEFHLEGSTKSCSMASLRLYRGNDRIPQSELCGADTGIPAFYSESSGFLRLRLVVAPRSKGGKGFKLSWTEILQADASGGCPGFLCKQTRHCVDHRLECNGFPNCGSRIVEWSTEEDKQYGRWSNFSVHARDVSDEKVNSPKCLALYSKSGPTVSNYQLLHVGIGVILTVILLILLVVFVLCREHKKSHKKRRGSGIDLQTTRQLIPERDSGFATVRNGHSTATLTREKMQKISIV